MPLPPHPHLTGEAEQNVLGTDAVVLQHPGLLLSQDQNPSRALGEPLEHFVPSMREDRWHSLRWLRPRRRVSHLTPDGALVPLVRPVHEYERPA